MSILNATAKNIVVLMFGVFIAFSVIVAQAQIPTLSQIYVSDDGTFIFNYPDGWRITLAENGVLLSNFDAPALDRPPGTGELVVLFVDPAVTPSVNFDDMNPAVIQTMFSVLLDLTTDSLVVSETRMIELDGRRTIAAAIGDGHLQGDNLALAVEFRDGSAGLMLAVTGQGELAEFEPLIQAVAATFNHRRKDLPQACTVTPRTNANVNLREGPGTDFSVRALFAPGETRSVTDQATGTDGFIWWQLENGLWVREDVVDELGLCDQPFRADII